MSELDEEKKFYERFNALMGDRVLRAVVEKYGIEPFRRSSVLEGFDTFICETGFAGTRCVEIGTCNGLTALVLARYFKEVVSIDVAPSPYKHEIARFAGIDNVRFCEVTSNANKYNLIKTLEFDAAYVDGDHARDTMNDWAAVRHCGQVLFHEYWQAQPPVWQLVNSLRTSGRVKTKGKFALWRA